jgi:hypothetical protein
MIPYRKGLRLGKQYLFIFAGCGLYLKSMEQTTQSLKELYEKDFYRWVMENLKLLKNKEYDLVDWKNLLEEIEDMGQRHYDAMVSYMAVIMEHLYKWENFRYSQDMGHDWIETIYTHRRKVARIFRKHPSLRVKAQGREVLQEAWEEGVHALIDWFKLPRNKALVQFYFKGRIPTEKDFPQECPYSFEQIMEYEPWLEE